MAPLTPQLTPDMLHPSIRPLALRLVGSITAAGGRALVVGGAVRDALMGHPAKDLDLEVYHLPADKLEAAIAAVCPFDAVGRSFGVYKLKHHPIDVSLPRRESKTGQGHRGFEVVGDPSMSFPEACARRDFTINAMLWDLSSGEIIDPWGGQKDLAGKILRHTSPHFAEDPLRVLRAMQFAARFQFDVHPHTVLLCHKITPENLPPERLLEEWKKLILKGVQPSLGLQFLKACGWTKYFPELQALIDCPQDPEWHPEGDAWIHTLHCMDAFARDRDNFSLSTSNPLGQNSDQSLDGSAPSSSSMAASTTPGPSSGVYGTSAPDASRSGGLQKGAASPLLNKENEKTFLSTVASPKGDSQSPLKKELESSTKDKDWENLITGFAVLLHDIGKPPTTQYIDGRWRSRAHDIVGVPIAERFLRRLTNESALIDQVLPLVECHMRPRELWESKASDAAVRRLARKVGRIDRLIRVSHADMQGRPPMSADFPEGPWLLQQAERLRVADSIPQPLILGRHLIELGHSPGPAFKPLLDACYEAQLDGAFADINGGLQFLQGLLDKNKT